MQTLIIELTGDHSLKAVKELESKHLIRIIDNPDSRSFALPGQEISEQDFNKWIEYTENSPTVSLSDAEQRWSKQKKVLQRYIS